jgi:hypothetical protein
LREVGEHGVVIVVVGTGVPSRHAPRRELGQKLLLEVGIESSCLRLGLLALLLLLLLLLLLRLLLLGVDVCEQQLMLLDLF